MKKYFLLIILIITISSCKEENEMDLPVKNQSSTEIKTPRKVNAVTTVNSTNNIKVTTVDGNSKRTAVVNNNLGPFNKTEVLKFLKLEQIKSGMKEEDLKKINVKANQNLESATRKSGEGDLPVYNLTVGGIPMVEFYSEAGKVTDISFTHKNSTPPNMIGIGDTYADILRVYPTAQAMGSQIESRVSVRIGDTYFLLDALYGVAEKYDAPLDSKIKWITVR